MMSTCLPSCDTFVALPPATLNGCVVFGKNSDRTSTEVQEVVYFPGQDCKSEKLQCTYIEIEQVGHTHAVILSKPAWMWGAEMGANEYGVCIGNEAVWDKLNGPDDLTERLLGMDLLRLGLERGSSAREALGVITSLLEKHGQGGSCYDTPGHVGSAYHNSFLIADRTEAWILETADRLWAAEHITEGVRNISNEFTITTKIDLCSAGLHDKLKALGWYSGSGDLNFAEAVGEGDGEACGLSVNSRYTRGKKLLKELSKFDTFSASEMMQILRDGDSGICMDERTTGSQVSVLPPPSARSLPCHWFTATPNPQQSVFKPFVFTPEITDLGGYAKSPDFGCDDPVRKVPRFKTHVDRRHELYRIHEKFRELVERYDPSGLEILKNLKSLESKCLSDMREMLERCDGNNLSDFSSVFPTVVNQEMSMYTSVLEEESVESKAAAECQSP